MTIYLYQEYGDIYIRDYLEFIIGHLYYQNFILFCLLYLLKQRITMISYTALGIETVQLQKVILI